MRERRYVKFKLDLYDDTKTKIIDQRLERDFIHYFFARSIILAGKANKEGDLYMAKDIPYTIDTLAIEFGREAALIKVALDVLIELKMIVVTADNIYRVKGFVKHQNIKVKEKEEIKNKEERKPISPSNKEVDIKEDKQTKDSKIVSDNIKEECKPAQNKDKEQSETHKVESENYKTSDNINSTKESDINKYVNCLATLKENQSLGTKITDCNERQEVISHNVKNVDSGMVDIAKASEAINTEQNNLVILETKDNSKGRRMKKSQRKDDLVTELAVDKTGDGTSLLLFSEGDMPPLREGERVIWGLTLG
ncbi:phage replisome organizer N-terminal domain-containing protein [Clostridium sp. C2-6-12]|uniref:phage replisome organizer N-terminal domain-containing protein n=1 Tax=Clostridium sp. C2-6-12 TaxID=2698832 RepID=UPI001367D12E|nr:phage replisome organizer N-terminal domain-containing protein [Clostridium sp. C2-6-12]